MEQGKLPILTKEQLKRFQNFLIEIGFVKTQVRARKVTETPRKCRQVFFQVLEYIEIKLSESDICELVKRFSLADVFDLYSVDDNQEKSNHTHDKVCFSSALENHIHDKALVSYADDSNHTHEKSVDIDTKLSNQIHDKSENLVNHTHDKKPVRGKQKSPRKVRIDVMIDKVQHDRLETLQGNTSQHVRQAIDLYLKTNFPL